MVERRAAPRSGPALALGLAAICAGAAPARAGQGDLLVSLSGPGSETLTRNAMFAPHLRWCRPSVGACLLRPPVGAPASWHQALRGLEGVRAVDLDAQIQPQSDELGTPDCGAQWEWFDAHFDLADGIGAGAGATAAVLDSGFLLAHEELVGRLPWVWDYGEGDDEVSPVPGVGVPAHGTFIAGLLAADRDNDRGRAGVSPEVGLALVKIADADGALWWSTAVDAIGGLLEEGPPVAVLNYSLAGSAPPTAMIDAVAALGAADVVLVAAAGNCGVADCWDADNDEYPLYPANDAGLHVLTVAGTTPEAELNPYSHYGLLSVDLAAPGVDLCSLDVGATDAYSTASGTSYAAPLVAGAVARVRGRFPGLRADEVVHLIKAAAQPTPALAGKVEVAGRLDALEALSLPLLALPAPSAARGVGAATLPLAVESRAGGGSAWLVVAAPTGVTVAGPAGALLQVAAGGALPWDPAQRADEALWLLPFEAPAAGADGRAAPVALALELQAEAGAAGALRIGLVGVGPAGGQTSAPTDGDAALLGTPAWSVAIEVDAMDDVDDSADTGRADPVGDEPDPPAADAAKGAGCASAPGAAGLWAAAAGALFAVLARRRPKPLPPPSSQVS
ncbi:MAG: S8 family serine peptidase [Deltaproteobacteria bacterium]|nr:S8 family serine peptidase [Deltaproteobacteria bacterium]